MTIIAAIEFAVIVFMVLVLARRDRDLARLTIERSALIIELKTLRSIRGVSGNAVHKN